MSNVQIVFYTKPRLPKAVLFTMGVSIKEKENSIGFFGTGLKYAIAVLLRLGAKIEISSYNITYNFHTETDVIRDKEFQMIKCRIHGKFDDVTSIESMPMTTDYGKQWEPWMALRELYSNTVDENGEMWLDGDGRAAPARDNNGTYIVLTCDINSELYDAWNNRHGTWLLTSKAPVWENENLQVFLGESDTIYYQGIRVSSEGIRSAVTYNIKSKTKLTEDRTYSAWDFQWDLKRDYLSIDQRDICHRIIEASRNNDMIESNFQFDYMSQYGSMQMREELISAYQRNPDTLNHSARSEMARYMREHHFDDTYETVKLDSALQRKWNACVNLINAHGIMLHKYRTVVGKPHDNRIMGIADTNSGTIVVNVKMFDDPNWHEEITKTLIEEYFHLEYEVSDSTRNFQDRALDCIYDLMIKRPVRTGKTGLNANDVERLIHNIGKKPLDGNDSDDVF